MTREEAKEALSVLKIYDNQWLREAVDMAIEALSAEVGQRGEWVLSHIGTIAEGFYCSRCGKHGYQTDFCPNCGADMRGGDDK